VRVSSYGIDTAMPRGYRNPAMNPEELAPTNHCPASLEHRASGLRLRPAHPGEAETLSAIAREAKGSWGYPEHWLSQWQGALTISPGFIASGLATVAVDQNEIAGFYGLEWRDSILWLEHLWIRPAWMRQGVGTLLAKVAMNQAHFLGSPKLYAESDPNAEGFYLRLGGRRVDAIRSQIDGCVRIVPILEFVL